MPIKVPHSLPATSILSRENIFVMTEKRALRQDIRPLKILIVNIMPTKEVTETQLLRLIGNTPLQIEPEFLRMSTHKDKHTDEGHLKSFYITFDEVKKRKYDGMILTGAPVETLPFTEVDYWDELCEILDWAKTNVYSSYFICWGAQAALYYYYGIDKIKLPQKLSGVYCHKVNSKKKTRKILRGFDDKFYVPHSRHTTVLREDIEKAEGLDILAESKEAGVYLVAARDGSRIFATGHSEYDLMTLDGEYKRDLEKGLNPHVPENYYPMDNPQKTPVNTWRAHANLIFSNWLNYYVYQTTPYDINKINE